VSVFSLHNRAGRSAALLATTAAAALGVTAPAWGVVRPLHQIISFPSRDFVSATGYTNPVTVEVRRNGHLIGISDRITPDATQGGLVEVNHPGGGCWQSSTPDILPGDAVRILDGAAVDETITANVTATAASGNVAAGTVTVTGTAQTATGGQIPLAELEQRIVANQQAFDKNNKRTLRASSAGIDGTLAYTPANSTNWTATYTGLSANDVTRATSAALNNETRILWLGPAADGTEQTIFETAPDPIAAGFAGGPTPPCTAPAATTSIVAMSRNVVNAADVSQPITIDGVAVVGDVTSVNAQLGTQPVHNFPVRADGTWTATIPAEDLAATPDGTATLTVSYVGVGAPLVPQARTITKDTVAPPAPTATPGAGQYPSTQAVTLNDADQSAAIFYTNDGTTPTPSSPRFPGQITISASQTIMAIARDAVGNTSPVAAFPFVIGAIANPNPPNPNTPNPPVRPARALTSLTVASSIKSARLRARGLRATLGLGSTAHVVRVRVFRATRGGKKTGKALASTFRVPLTAGTLRVTLRSRSLIARMRPGRYLVEARAGESRSTLQAPLTRRLRVVR
jgi:hypothetical protein